MPTRPAARWAAPALGLAALVVPAATGQATAIQPGADQPRASETPLVFAHRGASGYAPENTLAAAQAAADLGIAWVETDVQRTADGELVLVHDTTLARTTNVEELFPGRAPWNVSDFTAEEIARLDAGSWFGEEFAGETVPTLAEFLDALDAHDQRLLLELKKPELYPGIEKELLAELAAEGWLDERRPGQRLVLQSFNADSMRSVHDLDPAVKTGFLGAPAVADLPEYAGFVDQINPNHADLSAGYVAEIQSVRGPHGRPLEVNTWTVNDEETATKVADLGVDGIITDVPDVVRDAVGGR
jgi:glycerophosphoryl diester phosphodiesterase